ncbi:sulfurtransferase [Umezakia ovalisporum]|jgi:thiosulfate/3-mercaptopyruvate sulfurtransferase|uniref:sulfurtransferase n=1 Tax=Umezakia ovalisporum TaxID=75695 RepID=UPI0006F03B82|nr:sulfurtransferase [Umezakia ovalisporum]MBI1243319.1 sulfurtransferase [Nostoc sp. RI_552]MDH6068546.1 sulfurtransferase [Umezakia ovalisporum APH033B]MDH6083671.1 sulfurtransferase [Umezakia ovalisporum TAC611]MDH6089894.1 sulfurtransferase [Umezakia ovalisporum Ak1311]MDH6103907.1 sulfurtransferase [Umezakia ovalisporum ANA283AFssAo]
MNNPRFFVSPSWLLEHLNHPLIVIVDCRFSLAHPDLGKQQYQENHIENSYYLDLNHNLSSTVKNHGGRHPLPNINDLALKLSAMRVDFQKTLVVAYDDSRLCFASRLWWLLRYLGHEKVVVLDGGFTAWQKLGYPVTNITPPVVDSGNYFAPNVNTEMVVDIEGVKNRKDLPTVALVDSRTSDRYRGEHEPIDKIAGHIPGAVNYPWLDVTSSSGYLLSSSEQRQRWEKLECAEEIIVYCGSGVTACVNLLSLAIANIHTGKLYAGGWSDWISYD